ncbi:MAG: hypothetical protein QOE70_5804 [Chthoniobacter sp.]|nr:hypothetical protein [Chthoniobacter sp.]
MNDGESRGIALGVGNEAARHAPRIAGAPFAQRGAGGSSCSAPLRGGGASDQNLMNFSAGEKNSPRDRDGAKVPACGAERIKLRIFVPLILAVAVLLASFIFALRQDQNRRSELEIRRTARDLQKLLQSEQRDDTDLMATTIQAVFNDERMAQAFRARDRDALLQRAGPLLETLRTQHRVTHFYFHGPDRVNLLRVHHPDQFGDLVNRFTLLEAERTGQMASGVERGPIGRFILRVVVPWREGGQLLGYLELGMEFKDLIGEIRGVLDVDFVAAIQKKFLDREQWNKAIQVRGPENSWDQFPDYVVIDQTMRSLPEPIAKRLASNPLPPTGTASQVTWNGRVAHLVQLRLEDVGGKGFGDLFVMRDVTDSVAQARQSIWFVSVICVSVSALLLGLFYVFLGRIQKRLAEKTSRLTAEILERRRAEETLRASEANMAAAQRIAHFASWELDLTDPGDVDANPLRWSNEMFRIAGYEPGAVTVNNELFFSLVPEDEHGLIQEAVAAAIRERGLYSICHRLVRPDGEERVVHERGQISFDERTGQPLKMIGTTHDITERRQAEAAVLQNQRQLRGLIDGLGPSMFVGLLTTEGILMEVNSAPLAAAGLRPEDVRGQPFAETHWWSSSPAAQQQLREAIVRAAGGEASRYDVRTRGAGHEIIDIDFSLQPLRDETGKVVFLVPSASVITERKRAEEVLRETEIRLALAMSMAQLVAWEYDVASGLFTFSDHYYLLHDTTAELEGGYQMTAEDFARKFVHPHDTHVIAVELGKAISSADPGYRRQVECRIFRRDGQVRDVLTSISATKDATGQTVKIHGANQDITERKQAEEALRTSKRMLEKAMQQNQQVLDNSVDVVCTIDAAGLFTSLSAACEKIFGYSPAEMIGRPFLDFILPEDRASTIAGAALLPAGQELHDFENRYVRKDGTIVPVSWSATWSAADQSIFCVGRDCSDRKHAEEAQAARQVAERAILEKRGHSVVHAPNGLAAVDAAAHDVFDLIMMDVQMPEMDGFEATRRIREAEEATGSHTPIVAMTAHAMAGDRERCLAAGMDDYLSKPLRKSDLLTLIGRISAPVAALSDSLAANVS